MSTTTVKNTVKYAEGVSNDDFISYHLPWQKKGLQQTASGYGKKLTTIYKIWYKKRLYRVYAVCFSSVASHYIIVKNEKLYIS